MTLDMGLRLFQKQNGFWYVEFDRNHNRSLKTQDQKEAEKLFKTIREEAFKGRIKELKGEKTAKPLGEFRDEYEAWARDAITSHSTFRANMLALDKIIDIAGRSFPINQLSQRHIDRMIADCRKVRERILGYKKKPVCCALKTASINNYIRHARSVLNKAVDWKYIASNPFQHVHEIDKDENRGAIVYIHPKDVTSFLSSIPNTDERRLMVALIYSGRRRKELLSILLTPEYINFEENEYLVTKTKGRDEVAIHYPMHPLFRALVQTLVQERGWDGNILFPRWTCLSAYTHNVKEILRAAGYGNLSLHKMRHTFAVLAKEQGVDLDTIGGLLGHSDRKATAIYAHITTSRLQTAICSIKGGMVDLGHKQ